MKNYYISLGGACDVAMIMKELRIRSTSLPFDWLWNLDNGLAAINAMIRNNFQDVMQRDAYCKIASRFSEKSIAYKKYPSILHFHSNPYERQNDHNDLMRRFERFRSVISSNAHLHFIYYRNFEEDKFKIPAISIKDTLTRMKTEADEFLHLISGVRGGKTSIVLVLQTGVEDAEIAEVLVKSAVLENPQIKIGYTIARVDHLPELKAVWRDQWMSLIISQISMSSRQRLVCISRRHYYKIKDFFHAYKWKKCKENILKSIK